MQVGSITQAALSTKTKVTPFSPHMEEYTVHGTLVNLGRVTLLNSILDKMRGNYST